MKTIYLKVEVPDNYDTMKIETRGKFIHNGKWIRDVLTSCDATEIHLPTEEEIIDDSVMRCEDDFRNRLHAFKEGANFVIDKIKSQ